MSSAADRILIRAFTEVEAHEVARWSYDVPFDLYNGQPDGWRALLDYDPVSFGYYGLIDTEPDVQGVIGFCCFGPEARVPPQLEVPGILDIGGGIRPDLVSQGMATSVFPAILGFGRERWQPDEFRVVVAVFNERSLRLCRSAGFLEVKRFEGPAGREFVELTRPV